MPMTGKEAIMIVTSLIDGRRCRLALLAIICTSALTACGSSADPTTATGKTSDPSSTSTDTISTTDSGQGGGGQTTGTGGSGQTTTTSTTTSTNTTTSTSTSSSTSTTTEEPVEPTVTSVDFPFLFSGDVFPTYMAHLLGTTTPYHPTDDLVCLSMTNPAKSAVKVHFTVGMPGYAADSSAVRSVPKGKSTQCFHPIPDLLGKLNALVTPLQGAVHYAAVDDATKETLVDESQPVTIWPSGYVRFSGQWGDPIENYVASVVMPKSTAITQNLNPLTAYSRWGTFGMGGYEMHTPNGVADMMELRQVTIAADEFRWFDMAYFEAGETISIELAAVSGGVDDMVDFFVADSDALNAFLQDPCGGGMSVIVNGVGSHSGASFPATAPQGGWYYLAARNCGSLTDRDLTWRRTGTRADVVVDGLAATFHLLRDKGLVYTDLGGDFFYGVGQTVRKPSQSIADNSANCVDGSLLFASFMENIQLEPVLVHGPGHMFMGVRQAPGGFVWPIETTMVGDPNVSFEDALNTAIDEYQQWSIDGTITEIDVKQARLDGILPMPGN